MSSKLDTSSNGTNGTSKTAKKVKQEQTNLRKTTMCQFVIIFSSIITLFLSIFIGTLIYEITSFRRIEKQVKYMTVLENVNSYKWYYVKDFLSKETTDLFRSLAMNGEPLTTVVEDTKNLESAGEAVPIGHLDCNHPYMTLNTNRTMCHFSNRLDVGLHFVKTGGFNGYIEYFERMVARIIPFRKRLVHTKSFHHYNSFLNLNQLKEFNTDEFINNVRSVCANEIQNTNHNEVKFDSIINEIFQLDIMLILPGQELPMHLNVPYFWGADRNRLPHWLLVLMKNSKLFDHLFIPQVQGMSWFSTDELISDKLDENTEHSDLGGDGADFYFYPYLPDENAKKQDTYDDENPYANKYVILKPTYNSAVFLDGAQVIHGLDRYKPEDVPPLYAYNHHYTIRFDKLDSMWHLYDFRNNLLRSYYKNDVKLMLVWNMHCFANESQRVKFRTEEGVKQLELDEIAEVFKKDLKAKNSLPSDDIALIDLWTIALKTYLKYPVNTQNQKTTIFGFNYCLLTHVMPKFINDNMLYTILKHRC